MGHLQEDGSDKNQPEGRTAAAFAQRSRTSRGIAGSLDRAVTNATVLSSPVGLGREAAFHNAPPPEIRRVTDARELGLLARFRYSVYVEEMGRSEPHADHQARTLIDPLDGEGVNLAAFVQSQGEDEIVGCVRLNYAWRQPLDYYEDFYEMRGSPSGVHPTSTGICTRLMVGRHHRRSDLPVRLVRAAYSRALIDGVRHGYIDCNPHLNDFFLRMGFEVHCGPKIHPVYGTVTVLRLAMHDIPRLDACHSPLAADLRDWLATASTRQPDGTNR